MLMVLFVIAPDCDAWRRRRRRRCTRRSCEVSYWSSWSTCSSDQCGQQGSQRRSRSVESSPNCGGEQCPDLFETRLCYGSKPVNCHLSYWSEWNACTSVCGVSGKQTIYRHRIRTEQCGGVCTSTFYKTRACPLTSCLNGGSLGSDTCFCKKGFGGNCCEKEDSSLSTGGICGVVIGSVAGVCFFIILSIKLYKLYKLYKEKKENQVTIFKPS